MPKLISFDIGIKNLAYCIFDISDSLVSIVDWNVMDISKRSSIESESKSCNCIMVKKGKKGEKEISNPCLKTAKYSFGDSLFFCEKHAKNSEYHLPSKEFEKSSLKKLSVENLSLFLEKWKINLDLGKITKVEKIERIQEWIGKHVLNKIEIKKKGEPLDFIQIGRNLAHHLSKLNLENIHYVLIENQISPIANKMRTIQGMVAQMFIIRDIPVIEFISSSNKLKDYLGKTESTATTNGVNPDYKQHKKDGIHYTREWLESPKSGFINWKSFFNSFPKKQDDLADAFLQGIWYIRKKMGVSLEMNV